MRITIKYESSWRNSFLLGSNNEPIPEGGRKFIASSAELRKEGNFKYQAITKDTVMGILNRLIGDQQKLYRARNNKQYYFKEIEEILTDDCITDKAEVTQELVYLRKMGAEDKGAFTGMIKHNEPIFSSNYSADFWGILDLNIDDLCKFVVQGGSVQCITNLDPVSILNRLEEIKSIKSIDFSDDLQSVATILSNKYPDFKVSLDATGKVRVLSFYCSALYLQMERLEKQFSIVFPKASKGGISGISKNMHTPKDFMSPYTTGKKKLAYGTPFILKPKATGEVTRLLTKASGTLEIKLNIPLEKAEQLKEMIDAAGVSSFYLGKKGLAYIESIRTEEVL